MRVDRLYIARLMAYLSIPVDSICFDWQMESSYPKVIVWDLDGTIWLPEMYQLWGGGAPFKRPHESHLGVVDCSGCEIQVLGDARDILAHHRREMPHVRHAIASTCDEPKWGLECLSKIRVDEESSLEQHFDRNLIEIYKASSKETHFRAISKKSGLSVSEMIFFDNQINNIRVAERIGVGLAVYTPDPEGVTQEIFNDAIATFKAKLKR